MVIVNITMEKRAFQRTTNNMSVTFGCSIADFYSGILANMSEKGLFISTPVCFPLDSRLNILIHFNKEVLNISGRVRWMRKSTGIGVEVIRWTNNYLEFVHSLNLT